MCTNKQICIYIYIIRENFFVWSSKHKNDNIYIILIYLIDRYSKEIPKEVTEQKQSITDEGSSHHVDIH